MDDERVSSALGYTAHLVCMLAKYLQIPLRYQVIYNASRCGDGIALSHANSQLIRRAVLGEEINWTHGDCCRLGLLVYLFCAAERVSSALGCMAYLACIRLVTNSCLGTMPSTGRQRAICVLLCVACSLLSFLLFAARARCRQTSRWSPATYKDVLHKKSSFLYRKERCTFAYLVY